MTGSRKDKIILQNLTVSYEEKGGLFTALDDISFGVADGEFVSVIGSSGCGKSTLLSVLEGLLRPSGGSALIDGAPISGPGPDRGVVFQSYSLFPWMTARKNVAFGIKHARRELKRAEVYRIADEYLEKVGLSDSRGRYPSRLSGGMQQRVAIARALAMDTDILLMDEPFGAVDAKNRVQLQEMLLDLWGHEARRKTVVFITHDIDEAIFLSDRVVMLTESPGRVYRDIHVPFPRPRDRSGLLGSSVYVEFRRDVTALFFGDKTGETEDDWVKI
ncbi:MAG: ABC transporter ATP-binding protein [Oscillospiraceae bacterium]|jgi:NitT/TauT family transport system ATP-binding protein|nr:ABC transporter ATP-binding protein [Oscillospiraceae bacterium]